MIVSTRFTGKILRAVAIFGYCLRACTAIPFTTVITSLVCYSLIRTTSQVGAVAPIGGTSSGENPRRSKSNRRPSATLAFVLMTQLQFLATLSLVDYTVREDSWLADFVTGLRCDGQRLFGHPTVDLCAVYRTKSCAWQVVFGGQTAASLSFTITLLFRLYLR